MNMGIIRNPHTGGEYHIRTFDHGTCHNIYPMPTLEQTLSLACLHSSHLRGSGFWWQRQHRLHGVPGSHLGQKAPRVLVVDRGPMHHWTFWSGFWVLACSRHEQNMEKTVLLQDVHPGGCLLVCLPSVWQARHVWTRCWKIVREIIRRYVYRFIHPSSRPQTIWMEMNRNWFIMILSDIYLILFE